MHLLSMHMWYPKRLPRIWRNTAGSWRHVGYTIYNIIILYMLEVKNYSVDENSNATKWRLDEMRVIFYFLYTIRVSSLVLRLWRVLYCQIKKK